MNVTKIKKSESHKQCHARARAVVKRAVAAGLLRDLKVENVKCDYCWVGRAQVYGHRNYAKPFEVTPLCRGCLQHWIQESVSLG